MVCSSELIDSVGSLGSPEAGEAARPSAKGSIFSHYEALAMTKRSQRLLLWSDSYQGMQTLIAWYMRKTSIRIWDGGIPKRWPSGCWLQEDVEGRFARNLPLVSKFTWKGFQYIQTRTYICHVRR
jgi:hypothetical protein